MWQRQLEPTDAMVLLGIYIICCRNLRNVVSVTEDAWHKDATPPPPCHMIVHFEFRLWGTAEIWQSSNEVWSQFNCCWLDQIPSPYRDRSQMMRQSHGRLGQLDITKPDINSARPSVEMVPRYLPGVKLASDTPAPALTSQGPLHHANITRQMVIATYIAIALQELHPALFMLRQLFPRPYFGLFMAFITSHHDIQYCCAVMEIDTQYPAPMLHVFMLGWT